MNSSEVYIDYSCMVISIIDKYQITMETLDFGKSGNEI